MTKTSAQLDREIAESLTRTRPRPRRHHETMRDAWDVAMDAILEHDPKRAAEIVLKIREEHGVTVSATPAFSSAVREAPDAERQKFFRLLEHSFPMFYDLVRHPSDVRIWFKATEEMKKPGYKGLMVEWYAGDRKPKKAKNSSIQRMDISQGSYKRIAEHELPPEVAARFGEV